MPNFNYRSTFFGTSGTSCVAGWVGRGVWIALGAGGACGGRVFACGVPGAGCACCDSCACCAGCACCACWACWAGCDSCACCAAPLGARLGRSGRCRWIPRSLRCVAGYRRARELAARHAVRECDRRVPAGAVAGDTCVQTERAGTAPPGHRRAGGIHDV
ncbi:hypothetical protein FM113_14290 [Leucobacter sp. 7(1)]|nr:hypothetical protein FM113_14290 [Leucobacter sp. 7(1)]